MWTLIDEMRTEKDELGSPRGRLVRTFASPVGPIGCLVMVLGGTKSDSDAGTSVTFVPGVKLEKKKAPADTFEDGKWELVVASGYGEIPKTPDFDSK